jgi:hypothetical protein
LIARTRSVSRPADPNPIPSFSSRLNTFSFEETLEVMLVVWLYEALTVGVTLARGLYEALELVVTLARGLYEALTDVETVGNELYDALADGLADGVI